MKTSTNRDENFGQVTILKVVTCLVKERLKIGKRAARASNAHKLKGIMGLLLTTPGVIYTIPQNLRVNWGFNNDDTGKMLIPVEYFQEYNDNPVCKYDPSKIFRGLLQGLFLTHKYGISQITEPHIVYTAIQVRFVFGSQEIWSGQDAMFDYEVFTNTLFELFGLDKTWTRETLTWWNVQIFGRSTGLASKTLRESLQREQLWREQLLRVAAGRAAVERVAAERAAAERAAAILRANTKDNELEAGLTSDANTTIRHHIPSEDDDNDNNSEELPMCLRLKRGVNVTGSKQISPGL
ncbi:hypothetical protein EI94DRAFT_1709143 [Lactarius quietus]|nr:hypothetical protein EI94DRAFT_1709143 [Lactarius quietus]